MIRTGSGSSAWFHLESVLETLNAVATYSTAVGISVVVPLTAKVDFFYNTRLMENLLKNCP
jgi:hypothetical protein